MNQQQSIDPQQASQLLLVTSLMRRVKSGGNNFYWIAGLSVVNSLISAFGGGISFVIGLGITQIVDGIALLLAQEYPGNAILIKAMGLILSIGLSAVFVVFGYFAGKEKRWAFIVGMVFYSLDALILLAFKDWIAVLFHLFFLWSLWGGVQALNQLQKVSMPKIAPLSDFPKDIGSL
jgi:hypothetical protein